MLKRNPHRVIYTSSYDRGLEHLLKMWADIRREVPDAELVICYGWQLFDIGYADNPERQAWKQKMEDMMKQPGITHLGRISHEALWIELLKSGVHAYPTHFGEISCISCMKSQAAGAVPCVIDYAALKETVQFGIKIKGDIYDQETKDLYKNALIGLLNDKKYQEEVRKEMIPWAKEKFAWSGVAKQWDEEFKKVYPPKPKTIDQQVEELMDDNQALKAWDLVKDLKAPIRDRVWLKVRHAFDENEYKKYYSERLTETPVPEEMAKDCTKLAPRFKWVVDRILSIKPKNMVDFGCADGYLCLTLAQKDIECIGVNLYAPSVEIARQRAIKFGVDKKCGFIQKDVFDVALKTDCGVMLEVLEHLPDPQKAVDHVMSVSKTAFFSTPRTDHIGVELHKQEVGRKGWDDGEPSGHLRLFTEKGFKNLFKKYKIINFYTDEQRCMVAEVTKR